MHIQSIEIDNFKSFSGKTQIPFEAGFTTISGPNGSGKSNIIDSILFCLGLSSSRTMRAEKLTDLINNISHRREASVSILFGENTTTDTDAIRVTRKIKDNGKSGYGSTYYLNGKVATLTDIHDHLSVHNISPGAYNVLMQGDVTGIINMTAMERRKIIDEIAGVAEFDRKIELAEKELASVSTSIERFSILLEELGGRVVQLARDRDHALKYQELKVEKHRMEGLVLAAKWLDLKQAMDTSDRNMADARKQKKQAETILEGLETTLAQTRTELSQLANEVKRKGEDQQIALKKQIEGLKGAISRKKDSIQFGAEKRQEHVAAMQRIQDDQGRITQKLADIQAALEGYLQKQNELKLLLDKEQTHLDRLEADHLALTDATGELGERRSQARQALMNTQDGLSQLNRQKLDREAELERCHRDHAYALERSQDSERRMAEWNSQREDLQKQLDHSQQERQAFEAQINQQQRIVAEKRVALNQMTARMNQDHLAYTQLEAKKRAYEEVNMGRSVETILNADLPGVYGTLAQLGTVEEAYALALEIAMGGRIHHLVVEDDRVAQAGINLLQQNRAGRATFLPLNKMQDAYPLPKQPHDGGVIDFAVNLIRFDTDYAGIFRYALGDTLIVSDMVVARKYQRQYRMVTLDGTLFEKTGAMTGGSAKPSQGRLLSGKFDTQLADMRTRLEADDVERERMEKALTAAEIRLDSLKSDLNIFMGELQRLELSLESLNREAKQWSEPTTGSNQDISEIDAKIVALQADLDRITLEIATIEATLSELEATLSDIDAQLPTDQLEALRRDMDTVAFQVRTYETQWRNAGADIQSRQLEREFQEKGLHSIQEQMKQIETGNTRIEQDKQKLLEEIQVIEQQITALESQAGQLDEELQRVQAERDIVQARLIEEEHRKHTGFREVEQIGERILSYQARKKELHGEMEAMHSDLETAGLDIAALCDMTLPPSGEVLKTIQNLTHRMDAMEPVNMRAIQDYEEVTVRHTELSDKVATLNRERDDLGIKISGYTDLKRHTFLTAFENVDRNFRDIFADLSDGEGYLVLTCPDDPFIGGLTIEARPRGKKMQRLESMSGGEKSLTALAFVFSFQRYMPAPFYAFDEVDMFLDGINAEKLAHMVKKQSDAAQFIVVSLRKPMLQHSDRTVGVTQKRDGVSKVTGVLLQHAS
jgi:chromosome segregation protein